MKSKSTMVTRSGFALAALSILAGTISLAQDSTLVQVMPSPARLPEELVSVLRVRMASEQSRLETERYRKTVQVISSAEERGRYESFNRLQNIKQEKFIKNAPQLESKILQATNVQAISSDLDLWTLTTSDQGGFTYKLNRDIRFGVENDAPGFASVVYKNLVAQRPPAPLKVALVNEKQAISGDWRAYTDGILSPLTRVESLKLIKNPLDAWARRMSLLTGQEMSRDAMIAVARGEKKINLSKLPRYDRILLSSLEISKDSLGVALVEALKAHAVQNGTDVRILISQAYYRGLEHEEAGQSLSSIAYLKELEKATKGKVRVQFYEYNEPDYEGYSVIAIEDFHRVQHAKMILFMNDREPSKTRAVLGSRNMSNSHFLMEANQFVGFGDSRKYNPETYVSYSDMDIELQGASLIGDIEAQYMALWNRDPLDQKFHGPFQYFAIPGLPAPSLGSSKLVRHFLSVPYVNGGKTRGLEPLFIDMIDSAKTSLRIVTPYFHPIQSVVEALHRAMDRGVKVTIVTNIDFSRDGLMSDVVRAANRRGMIMVGDRAHFRVWKPGPASYMVHTKAMAIDEDTLYLGSANLNHRSFVHDVENGLLIQDKDTMREFGDDFENFYVKNSETITAKKVEETIAGSLRLRILKDAF